MDCDARPSVFASGEGTSGSVMSLVSEVGAGAGGGIDGVGVVAGDCSCLSE